jgi:Na+/H+-dicarboxylate symporter
MQRYLTLFVLVGLILGVAVGYYLHHNQPSEAWPELANFKLITDVFLRSDQDDHRAARLRRLPSASRTWFARSLACARCSVHHRVVLLARSASSSFTSSSLASAFNCRSRRTPRRPSALNLCDFFTHLVPTSIFDAMATNSILQIVVFSLFFGVALAALGEQAKPVVDLAERVSHVMLRVTGYVMNFAPLAVFAAIAATVTENGLDILVTYGKFIGGFYLGLVILWALLIVAGLLIVGPRILRMLGLIRDPIVLAFSTASSEAAYPRTFEALQKFGVSKRIAGFVLPLGYSFNLDGSMMYCTFAVLFIAQVYGIDLTWAQQVTMLLLLMVTSKGMAGVPRASLVVIAATLTQFGMPEAGLLLILGVDHFLDMGRSATNVVGNSVATAVVAKWEKELGPEQTDVPPPATKPPPLEDQGDTEIGR